MFEGPMPGHRKVAVDAIPTAHVQGLLDRMQSVIDGLRDALRTVLENKPDRVDAREIIRRISMCDIPGHRPRSTISSDQFMIAVRKMATDYLDRPEACQ